MAADLEFQKERANRARLIMRAGKPVEGDPEVDPEDGKRWRWWLDLEPPSVVRPIFVEAYGGWIEARRAALEALAARLEAAGDGDGSWWAFWCRAWDSGDCEVVAERRLGEFEEDRVYEVLEQRGVLDVRGRGEPTVEPGDRELGWLIAGRDAHDRPCWTVLNRSLISLTIPRVLVDERERPMIRVASLDRVDGRELVVSWLLQSTGERPPGVMTLVITREPTEALRRLWKSGVKWDHFRRILDRLGRELTQAPERAWTLSAFRRTYGHWPTERQAALRRLLEPRIPRHSLREGAVDASAGAGARSVASVRRATPTRNLALYPSIPVRHGPLMLFRTFVFDKDFPEPTFGYDACDYDRSYVDDYGEGCLFETDGVVFEALVGDVVEDSQRALLRIRRDFELEVYGEEKYWDRFQSSRYRSRLSEFFGDEPLEVRHSRVRTMPHPAMRGSARFGDDLSIVCHDYPEELRYRLCSDARDRIAYESRLEFLPDLNREQLYLNFIAPLGNEDLKSLRWAVLQIRVPLHLAWHGVPLGAPFGLRSANLGVLASEDGVRWFQDPSPGAPLRPRRLGLGDRIPLSGVGAGVPDLRLKPGALFLPAYEARCWPPPEPRALNLGPVNEMIVTGTPRAEALIELLEPDAALEP